MGATLRPCTRLGGVSPAVTQRQEKAQDEEEAGGGKDLWHRVVRGVRENLLRNKEKIEVEEEVEEEIEERIEKKKTKEMRGVVLGNVSSSAGIGERLRGRGLDRRNERRLRRGEMVIEERIDLHGFVRGEAREVLRMELWRCYERGCRCVLVISGKGRGILREEVMLVLDSVEVRDIVVAHKEARIRDGGAGARYVLLRRKR